MWIFFFFTFFTLTEFAIFSTFFRSAFESFLWCFLRFGNLSGFCLPPKLRRLFIESSKCFCSKGLKNLRTCAFFFFFFLGAFFVFFFFFLGAAFLAFFFLGASFFAFFFLGAAFFAFFFLG